MRKFTFIFVSAFLWLAFGINAQLVEDFEISVPPAGWIEFQVQGTSSWSQDDVTFYTGANSASFEYYIVAFQDVWLIAPVDVSTLASPMLTYADNVNFASFADQHNVKYSTDYAGSGHPNAATWTDINTVIGLEDTWKEYEFVLPAYGGTMYIAFQYVGQNASTWFIDDFEVKETPIPIDLSVLSPVDGEYYEYCDMTDMETITLEILNSGLTSIYTGDSLVAGYSIDGAPFVVETIYLTSDLNVGEVLTVDFTQTFDFSAITVYQIETGFQYTPDMNSGNNSIIAQIEHAEYALDLEALNGGGDDTLFVGAYPVTINAGTYTEYLWNTSETTASISVSADGWYDCEIFNQINCYDFDSIYVTLSISTQELVTNEVEIQIYPNPANEFVNIVVSGSESTTLHVQLISIQGQLIKSVEYNGIINEQLDVSDYAKGVYYMKLTSGKNVNIEKIVIH